VITSSRMTWVGHVVHTRDRSGELTVLVVRPEGRRLFGRHMERWEDNVKSILQEW